MFPIPTILYKWLAGITIVLAVALGAGYWGYKHGEEHQIAITAAATAKANAKVDQKIETAQDVADKHDKVQIQYKDRIVTKYQTITKEVTKYVETPAANLGLDPEFVRLHNRAANANGAVPIAEPASSADGQAGQSRVTTGDAIAVITRNYERYNECRSEVIGWQKFYTDLQNTVNKEGDK